MEASARFGAFEGPARSMLIGAVDLWGPSLHFPATLSGLFVSTGDERAEQNPCISCFQRREVAAWNAGHWISWPLGLSRRKPKSQKGPPILGRSVEKSPCWPQQRISSTHWAGHHTPPPPPNKFREDGGWLWRQRGGGGVSDPQRPHRHCGGQPGGHGSKSKSYPQ